MILNLILTSPAPPLARTNLDHAQSGPVLSDAILRARISLASTVRSTMLFRLPFAWLLAFVLIAALALRIVAGLWWEQRLPPGKKFAFGDSESYWQLARTIAHTEEYAYGPTRLKIFRTPGYPAVLAPLFLLANEPPVIWGRVVSALLGTAAVALVAWLALVLFDQRTALLAALLAAVYPEAIAASVFVLSEAPFTPLMLLNLICWSKTWKEPSSLAGWSFAAGVAAGLATLMRPSWLLFVPFAGCIGFGVVSVRRRHALVMAATLAALCLTMLPWWIRNYRVAGRFVPTSLQVGASLYDGLSPTATGASDMQFVGRFVAEQRAADAAAPNPPQGLFEDRLDQRLKQAALDWAASHPGRALHLVGIKFLRMWSPLPNAAEFQSTVLRLILAATYTPVMILAAIGIWKHVGRGWPYVLCCLPAIYLTLLHIIFVSSIRYREPAMLAFIVFAAAGWQAVAGWHALKRRGPEA